MHSKSRFGRIRSFLVILLISQPAAACRLLAGLASPQTSGTELSSAGQVNASNGTGDDDDDQDGSAALRILLLNAHVVGGSITTLGKSESQWLSEIRDQLAYTVGLFEGLGAVADMNRLEIQAERETLAASGQGYSVAYTAGFQVAWTKKPTPPPALRAYLPRRGDREGRLQFSNFYRHGCAAEGGDNQVTNFWYHYRPQQKTCPLALDVYDKTLAVHVEIELTPVSGLAGGATRRDQGLASSGH